MIEQIVFRIEWILYDKKKFEYLCDKIDELKEIEIHQLKHFNKLEYDRVYGEYLSLFEKHPESIFKYIRKRDGIISE